MLRGSLIDRSGTRGVLDVEGVGYEVFATSAALEAWSNEAMVQVHVSTQVREDAITLYAFDDGEQRAAFLALMTVQGVGPKVGLAALESLGAEALAEAVATDDIRALSTIPGVGKKTAQRLALDLKGKLTVTFKATARTPVKLADPLPLALARLGYTKSEIDRAADALARQGVSADTDTGIRLREALKVLSGNG